MNQYAAACCKYHQRAQVAAVLFTCGKFNVCVNLITVKAGSGVAAYKKIKRESEDSMETTKKKFFYGWVVVACLFFIAMFPLVFYSNFYSYYQVPVSKDLGISFTQFSASNMASTIAGMLFGLTMATRITKGKLRIFMAVGSLIGAAAFLAQSYVTAIWQLYITFFIANFALSSVTYIPINFLISQWFTDRKGLITSIVYAGSGIGGVLFSKPLATLLATQGWRAGFRLNAIICLVTAVVVLLLIRKSPSEMGQQPYTDGKTKAAGGAAGWAGLAKSEAVKTGAFWLYILCAVCCGIVAAGIFTQVPTFLVDNNVDYAAVMMVFSAASIFGKLVMGPVIDKVGMQKGSVLTSAIAIVALVLLALVPTLGAGAAYACMVIIPFGACIASLAPPLLTGIIFGYKDFGGIYGLGNTGFMAGCMIGPMMSSSIRDLTGSYNAAWIACIAVYAALALFAVLAVSSGKKLRS